MPLCILLWWVLHGLQIDMKKCTDCMFTFPQAYSAECTCSNRKCCHIIKSIPYKQQGQLLKRKTVLNKHRGFHIAVPLWRDFESVILAWKWWQ
jgi:hypothetical protein